MSIIRQGIHAGLEREANRLLRESMAEVTKHSEKSDILTPWKEQDRYRKEVYVDGGVPDPATRRGMFHRVANHERPELNSRDGIAPARTRTRTRGLAAHVEDYAEYDD